MADKLALEISIAEGIAFNYKKVKALNLKLNVFLRTLNTMTLGTVSYGPEKAYDNSGAEHYYGIGVYNGD